MNRAWRPGDAVVYRELWRGHLMSAMPMTLVQRSPGRCVLYQPAGVSWRAARLRGRETEWSRELLLETLAEPSRWTLVPLSRGEQNSLFIYETGASHTVRLAWDSAWSFVEWYVNFEAPWRQTPIGADSMDRFLDIVVAPDLTWSMKDEDELAAAVRCGLLDQAQATEVMRTAERLIQCIERRLPPFCEPWPTWRPDPKWQAPTLRAGWDILAD